MNPGESRSLRSLKIACKALQNSRVFNRMVLLCFYAFSLSHGRSPIARPCTLSNYWWWSTMLRNISRPLTRFDMARPFLMWHGRSVPGFLLHAWSHWSFSSEVLLDRRIRTGCKIWNDRAFPGWPSMPCTRSCTIVHCRAFLSLSDMHGRAYGRMTVPNAQVSFLHRIFAALSFCPESPRFRYHLVWYAVLGL